MLLTIGDRATSQARPDKTASDARGAAELNRTYQTLCRGAGFFTGASDAPFAVAVAISHRHRSKWIGNGLRELDRFLNLLIDEVARFHGLCGVPRQRNSANKLRDLRQALGSAGDDHRRLVALGSTRACLVHCDGIIRSAAMGQACWVGLDRPGHGNPAAKGAVFVVDRTDLRRVGQFYRTLGDELLRSCLVIAAPRPHLGDIAARPA